MSLKQVMGVTESRFIHAVHTRDVYTGFTYQYNTAETVVVRGLKRSECEDGLNVCVCARGV